MSEPLRTIEVRSHVEIPLADGAVLAARVWLPVDAESDPVPVVLEYLPYRLADGTAAGDHEQMAWFAERGYAGVRVDIRGSGESSGLLPDEYTVQEQEDGLEVIAWLAAQPWSSGAVGMIGYSWGGFNGLQLAARRPPALKAVVSGYASDDRYADDVHYRGGLVLAMDMLHWSACMHAWQARPPDPEVVGEGWRAQWLARMELPPWVSHWLAHQRRDAYWRNGSVRDDPSAIECAVLCLAGWTDGYSDAALRLVADLESPVRAIIGPWGHNDPAAGAPGPSIDLFTELLAFWDRWLKDRPNGWEDGPAISAYMQDHVTPSASLEERAGRWIAEPEWPSPGVEERTLVLGAGALSPPDAASGEPGSATVGSVQTVGLTAGAWCADGRSADLPLDQRTDDQLSLTFTSDPIEAPLEILGFPKLRLSLSADRPLGLVSVRLCEVAPDGSSLLVTRAQLNLSHRTSHADPVPVVVDEPFSLDLTLDGIAHRFAAGSRLRLAIAPCNWPLAWPSPEAVTLTIRHGGVDVSALVLPVRDATRPDGPPPPVGPQELRSLGSERLRSGPEGIRTITRDLGSGRTELRFVWDCGGLVRHPGAMLYEDTSEVTYTIVDDDPLSARVDVANTSTSGRDGWRVDIASTATMTSTADEFLTTSTLAVEEDGVRIFARTWDLRFPRDHA